LQQAIAIAELSNFLQDLSAREVMKTYRSSLNKHQSLESAAKACRVVTLAVAGHRPAVTNLAGAE
jgi:hypothetical protein